MIPLSQHDKGIGGALTAIWRERERQDALKKQGRFQWTAADSECPLYLRLGMLVEEVGEVARAVQGGHDAGDLREELVQCAAICCAWFEALSKTSGPGWPE